MDWIDEKLEKLKRWIYHADLKKALIFYICIAVASAALATVLTTQICSSWIEVLLTPYSEIELIRGIDQEGHPVFFHHKRTYQALPRSVTVAVMFLEGWESFFTGLVIIFRQHTWFLCCIMWQITEVGKNIWANSFCFP